MEPRVEQLEAAPVLLLCQGHEVGRSGASVVETALVDVDRGRSREHLEDPKVTWVGGPRVAEDGLVVAVDDAHVRGARGESEDAGGLVECIIDDSAAACMTTKAVR